MHLNSVVQLLQVQKQYRHFRRASVVSQLEAVSQVHFQNMAATGVAVGDPVLVTLCSVFPSLCVPSVSAGNLATSPVPGTFSQPLQERVMRQCQTGSINHTIWYHMHPMESSLLH
jgi:hypothetical protein